MNFIPLNAELIKGSHGRIPADLKDWPLLIGDFDSINEEHSSINAEDVYSMMLSACRKNNVS